MMDILRKKSVVVGIIMLGTIAGGGIAVYARDYSDLEAREKKVADLEKQVQEKQAIVKRLRESLEGKK
ncbi:hypothetical protein OS493_000886 [Desmophyllum pertusum]|uniref:Uncharacterized protein n=1 Tax=Desmophyllum pertusum TaxID=174260 RepID=A0A9X0D5F4_9CNID|nr:hypothetical protein OS493_000886 [Desmophyllum pertusum]